MQEFCGVVGQTESTDLETDMTKVPACTAEILASCHALVFVDNKLVCLHNFWHTVPRIPEFLAVSHFPSVHLYICLSLDERNLVEIHKITAYKQTYGIVESPYVVIFIYEDVHILQRPVFP